MIADDIDVVVRGTTESGAVFSPCGLYRYGLWRVWDDELPPMVFIGLNPSTADHHHDDPTIRRCVGFAKREGCGELAMLNLFAYRATDPRVMAAAGDPVGGHNDLVIRTMAQMGAVGQVIAAWGAHCKNRNRIVHVVDLVAPKFLWCLGTTKDGSPRHPLYVPKDEPLVPWEIPE